MADYYTSYSAEIAGLTDEEIAWVKSRIKEIGDADDEDAGCGLGEVEVANGAIWFHAEEYGDPEVVAEFARDFLGRFRPRDSFTLEYAGSCSRPRLDGFGGGAVFVTARATWPLDALRRTSDRGWRLTAIGPPEVAGSRQTARIPVECAVRRSGGPMVPPFERPWASRSARPHPTSGRNDPTACPLKGPDRPQLPHESGIRYHADRARNRHNARECE